MGPALPVHPSYHLHGYALSQNAQHLATQQAQWAQVMAAHPNGHFSRPSTLIRV